ALDQDAVGVLQVLLEGGRAAAAKARPQTGDGGGVSNAGLVLDLDRAERREQLLDQVVLFVVEVAPPRLAKPIVRRVRAPSASHCQPRRRASITRSAIMSMAVPRSRASH